MTKYLAKLSDFDSIFTQISLCTISSSSVTYLPPDFGNKEW